MITVYPATPLFVQDLEEIEHLIASLDWKAGDAKWRSNMPFTPHRHSETLFLRKQFSDKPRDVLNSLDCSWTDLGMPFRPTLEKLSDHQGRMLARAMLVKLTPRGTVTRHRDVGRYADATDRFHLPIETNSGALFEFWGFNSLSPEIVHMKRGVWYSFDKHIDHAAWNDGADPRIHLIVDLWKLSHVSPVSL